MQDVAPAACGAQVLEDTAARRCASVLGPARAAAASPSLASLPGRTGPPPPTVRPRVFWSPGSILQVTPPVVVAAVVGPLGVTTANSRPGSGPQRASQLLKVARAVLRGVAAVHMWLFHRVWTDTPTLLTQPSPFSTLNSERG